MELLQQRIKRGKESTLSQVLVDGKKIPNYYHLEDEDKNLVSTMTANQIASVKVHGRTAIPTGRYQMAWTFSKRFQKYTWELLNVPGFGGIRFHKGNYIGDTEGCQLPGTREDADSQGYLRVWNSGVALGELEKVLAIPLKANEAIWYTIAQHY